jgi:hypothetical protein
MGRSRKDPYSPTEGISAVWRGRGEKIVSISSVGVVWMFSDPILCFD